MVFCSGLLQIRWTFLLPMIKACTYDVSTIEVVANYVVQFKDWTMGLKHTIKMIGDRGSPWNMTLLIIKGNKSDCQCFVTTVPDYTL